MAEPTQPSQQPTFDSGQVVDATHGFTQPDGSHQASGWQTNEVPSSSNFNWLFNNISLWVTWFLQFVMLSPGANADTVLTVAVNAITPTQGNHAIDTAGGAATVNTIATTNLNAGRLLVLKGNNPGANLVTLANAAGGAGQLHFYDGNALVLSVRTMVTLQRVGADWYEVSRTVAGGKLVTIISSTTTYTPFGNAVRVRAWGGGGTGGSGGGGGGASGNTNPGSAGSAGGAGGNSYLGTLGSQYARGGAGGAGGAGGLANTSGNNHAAGGASAAGLATAITSTLLRSGAPASSVATGTQGGQIAGDGGVGGAGAAANGLAAAPFQWNAATVSGGSGGTVPGSGTGGVGGAGTAGISTVPGLAGAGGGGGGAGNNGSTQPGNGGAGGGAGAPGEFAEWMQSVTPGVALTATVGAGGVAGAVGSGGAGVNGGGNGGAGGAGAPGLLIIEE